MVMRVCVGGQVLGAEERLGTARAAIFVWQDAGAKQGRQGIGENGGADAWGQ
jgi:hypothetical protein